jgi:hypothetical protein
MAEPNGASIQALCRPSTRFRDSYGNVRPRLPQGWTEVELLPGLSVENIRATRLTTWDAFHRFARQKIVWMTPDVYVCSRYLNGDHVVLFLGANGGTRLFVCVTPGTAAATATATCDFLVRLFKNVTFTYQEVAVWCQLLYLALVYLSFSKRAETTFAKSLCVTWH